MNIISKLEAKYMFREAAEIFCLLYLLIISNQYNDTKNMRKMSILKLHNNVVYFHHNFFLYIIVGISPLIFKNLPSLALEDRMEKKLKNKTRLEVAD